MMCTTVLRGGVCHRTSTPHKNWNKMKEKKNKMSKEDDNLMKSATCMCLRDSITLLFPWKTLMLCNSDATNHG